MKKFKFQQLPKAVAKKNKKLAIIEQLSFEKSIKLGCKHNFTAAKILYYFIIALILIERVIDFIFKVVEAYYKIP